MDAAHQVIEFTSSFPDCRRYVFSTAPNIALFLRKKNQLL